MHGNSGVPNHAYALAVDGGTYNGQTVSGMGLDQAAAIWWRAQTAYLVPASNFTDAADGLEQTCTDLVGQPIRKLTTPPTPAGARPPRSRRPTAPTWQGDGRGADAHPGHPVQLQAAADPGHPVGCAARAPPPSTCLAEDFEDGLTGWAPTSELAAPGRHRPPWEATTSLPPTTPVAWPTVPTRSTATCHGSATDISSSNAITYPGSRCRAAPAPPPRC